MKPSTSFTPFAAALALAGALATSPALAAPTIAIDSPLDVSPGSTFELSVGASDVADLYAYQFDLLFDPSVFRAVGVTGGGFLSTAGTTFFSGGDIDNAAGTISFVFESLVGPGPGANGSGELLRLSFEAIGAFGARGAFSFANVMALDSNLADLDIGVAGSDVRIPEPATLAMAMLALGVLGAGLSGSRRRHAHAATLSRGAPGAA